LIAAVSLGVALQAARYAHAASARGPLQAEISQAQSTAIAQRWERAPLGQIFTSPVRYSSQQGTKENATLLGIGSGDSCPAALDATMVKAAEGFGCVAALRASYQDELGGTVYTVGVIVFPDDQDALAFSNTMPQGAGPGTGLNTLSLPGTASALFTNSARQTLESWVTGSYVVLVVSGYADGRPVSASAEPNDAIFGPAHQIMEAVASALAAPEPFRCGDGEFAC
jgi:hypothetical protein